MGLKNVAAMNPPLHSAGEYGDSAVDSGPNWYQETLSDWVGGI